MAKDKATRGGRKANEWSVIKFKDLESYAKQHELPFTKLADLLGVTNSTIHNWRQGRSTPDVALQEKIKGVLASPPADTGATKRAPRGAGSETLTALLGGKGEKGGASGAVDLSAHDLRDRARRASKPKVVKPGKGGRKKAIIPSVPSVGTINGNGNGHASPVLTQEALDKIKAAADAAVGQALDNAVAAAVDRLKGALA